MMPMMILYAKKDVAIANASIYCQSAATNVDTSCKLSTLSARSVVIFPKLQHHSFFVWYQIIPLHDRGKTILLQRILSTMK